MNSKTIVYIVVAIIVVIGVVLWLTGKSPAPAAPSGSATPAPAAQTGNGLGADIYSQVAPTSSQTIPETNPFKAVQTNPFGQ